MAVRYVRTNGNDGGSGHDGSTPALAWLTIGYAHAHVSAGDTIWVGAGVYRLGAGIAFTNMASMTYLFADTDGSHTGDAGEVRITAYSTNDSTAPTSMNVIGFSSKSFWTIRGFTIVGGGTNPIYIDGTSHDLTFQDCTIFSTPVAGKYGIYLLNPTWSATQAINLTIERCRIFSPGTGYAINLAGLPASATGADMNQNIIIRNCMILTGGGRCISITGTNNTYKSGGVSILNCTLIGGEGIRSSDGYISTTYPTTAYNNFITGLTGWTGTTATTLDDYNLIASSTTYTNVTQGAHSISNGSISPHFYVGQSCVIGSQMRPFGMFPAGHPGLAWGAAGTVTDDLLGGPRPGAGAGSVAKAVGCYERNNSWVKETGTVRTGSNALSVTGPGYQDFSVPVAASATTFTIYLRYDSTYAGTLPSLNVLNGGECGVANASALQVGAADTWEAVSIGPFTPTAAGIVTVRLLSSDTNGGGKAFADDWAVT